MEMRIRYPELLAEHGITPYKLHVLSGGRIPLSTAYRLAKKGGAVRFIDSQLLDALCDTLGVEPTELLTRDE